VKKKTTYSNANNHIKTLHTCHLRFHTTSFLALPSPVSIKFSFQNVNLWNENLNFLYNRPFINTLYVWDSQPYWTYRPALVPALLNSMSNVHRAVLNEKRPHTVMHTTNVQERESCEGRPHTMVFTKLQRNKHSPNRISVCYICSVSSYETYEWHKNSGTFALL